MPRKNRTISSTGIYHIILRSVNQQLIFEDETDYQKFLFILSDCKEKYDIDILAYCLMDNHIHLLVCAAPDLLSVYFQSVGTNFARWYNRKYKRCGHLFQDRFYSKVVENDTYYLNTIMYIHNNPVAAGMCQYPHEYRWSSYNVFYGESNSLVNVVFSYMVTGSKDSLQHYFSINSSASMELDPEDFDIKPIRHFLTDEQAIEVFKSLTNQSSKFDVPGLPKIERNKLLRSLREKGLTLKQIARITGVSIATVNRVLEK